MNLINRIKCLFLKHVFVPIGECPYTGYKYNGCQRCLTTVPIKE